MAGKPVTRGSVRVARTLDNLSKNTLADIVLDLIQGEIGDDSADEAILERIQETLDTVQRIRGDRPANLLALLAKHDASEERERKRKG